jgi:hypothetical protein
LIRTEQAGEAIAVAEAEAKAESAAAGGGGGGRGDPVKEMQTEMPKKRPAPVDPSLVDLAVDDLTSFLRHVAVEMGR